MNSKDHKHVHKINYLRTQENVRITRIYRKNINNNVMQNVYFLLTLINKSLYFLMCYSRKIMNKYKCIIMYYKETSFVEMHVVICA